MCDDWREKILGKLDAGIETIRLVADPDYLFSEERLLIAVKERGFDVVIFEDSIAFRYFYENSYREYPEKRLVVIVNGDDLTVIPYDIYAKSDRLSFSLAQIFEPLSYPVLKTLHRKYLEKLYAPSCALRDKRLNDRETKEFILRHAFGIDLDMIHDKIDLLKCLLQCHYGNMELPDGFREYIAQKLSKKRSLPKWPIRDMVLHSERFFDFLQERWPEYLKRMNGDLVHDKPQGGYKASDTDVPFSDKEIKVYIDNLFLEGYLQPVAMPELRLSANAWERCGLVSDDSRYLQARLFENIEKSIPEIDSHYDAWLEFALKWAKLNRVVFTSPNGDRDRLNGVFDIVDSRFREWLGRHYATLYNLPARQTTMVHHIPKRLAGELERDKTGKVALIVVDGLALDQFETIRNILRTQLDGVTIVANATFAWIPTLTSVSRQAIFSGKVPLYFANTIDTTANEKKEWEQFWEDLGFSKKQIAYGKGLGKHRANAEKELTDILIPGKTRIVGLVINTVDDIMHGMELGASGMHTLIEQWAKEGYLATLISTLLDGGFQVWLTSDHGNIECEGKGTLREGVLAESRGERVRIYNDKSTCLHSAEHCEFAYCWENAALPESYMPLIAKGKGAFVQKGKKIVGHGGASLEEVIVPFIKFERDEK